MRNRYATVLAGVAVCALLAAGCSEPAKPGAKAPEDVEDGVVAMTLDGPINGYDPAMASTFQDAVVDAALYDTLIHLDSAGKPLAGLAESWSSTARTATFRLKSGVTCSDGTALTSAMVAASLNRLFDPKTKAPLVGQAIGSGNVAKARASGRSVQVTLKNPWSDLLQGMAAPYAGIVCPSGLKDPAKLRTKSAGTGAFVSKSAVAGSSYTFTRRTDYDWGPSYPKQAKGELPKQLVLKVVDDENTRANLMSSGELEVASFSSDAWNRFASTPKIGVQKSAQSDTMLVFNQAEGHPTADQDVRLAIAQAINRNALNKVQSFGSGELMTSIGESSDPCFDKSSAAQLPKYDTAAAGKALKGVKVRIVGTNILAGGDANKYLQSALEAAGADASVQTKDNQAWVSDLFGTKGDWDVTIFVYGNRLSSFLQVGNFFVNDAPPNGVNFGGIENPEAQQAFEEAAASSPEDRCAALTTFQRALLKRNDVLPLATAPVHVLFAGGTSGNVVNGFAVPSSVRLGSAGG